MLPLIHREIVFKKHWVSEESFCDILGVTQAVPGAMAINSAIFIGYDLAGVRGALIATLGISLPSFLIILGIAAFFTHFSESRVINEVFSGIRPAVVALIAYAGLKLGKAALSDWFGYFMAGGVLLLHLIFGLSPFFTIMIAAITGTVYYKILCRKRGIGE